MISRTAITFLLFKECIQLNVDVLGRKHYFKRYFRFEKEIGRPTKSTSKRVVAARTCLSLIEACLNQYFFYLLRKFFCFNFIKIFHTNQDLVAVKHDGFGFLELWIDCFLAVLLFDKANFNNMCRFLHFISSKIPFNL